MATIKAYTDIEQSRKLAEILPLESADMCYYNDGTAIKIDANSYLVRKKLWQDIEVIPCWSLAVLLEQLEGRNFVNLAIKYDDGQYYLFYVDDWGSIDMKTKQYNNLIDACVEMILKLHKQNLL